MLLPWLETLAASSVPRLSERSLAGVLNAIQFTAEANGLEVLPRGEHLANNALVLEGPNGQTFAVFVGDDCIDVQSWDKSAGRTEWERIDTKRRPGGYLPPGGEVTA